MDNILIICRNLGIRAEDLEEMATGARKEELEPTYNDMIKIYTRGKNNLSQEEKMRLARIILGEDRD